jgi:hypothetical protein
MEGDGGMSALPAWAENMRPVDMEGAAALLGIARRTLVDVIRHNPHYEKRGVKKVFYPEHIALLREAILCQKGALVARDSALNSATVGYGKRLEALPENAFERALALATKPKPSNSKPTSKRGSGNVIPMAKKP